MKQVFITSIIVLLLAVTAFSQTKKTAVKKKASTTKKISAPQKNILKKEVALSGPSVKIITDSGTIIVRLYDKTPRHRDNFLKLVAEHFYDSLLFHRVIDGFMIQGGDPESKNAAEDQMLGKGDNGYTIPAEFDSTLFHKKGALAAARTNNPEKASSGCQFYIVQGKKYTDEELDALRTRSGDKVPTAIRAIYKEIGGTPFLDMNYTVFGEVEEGLETVDKIAKTPRDVNNRPLTDIRMKIEIIK